MHIDEKLKDLLTKANLTGLLAKRYEYVDPQKHMYYYQLHFKYVMQVEKYYMNMQDHSHHYMNMHDHSHHGVPGQFPMY
ncbi:hypothetical protein [Gracilibacillus sp. YIM 98692]|uniref:hypothetical protein n=1 Tax=Gracilibacillus sp. YIM 98692 TaxID=2663532 RepID=UPI0013D71969|nr:hypothetical protein [Gracilibacillus sp. YIM 98692]